MDQPRVVGAAPALMGAHSALDTCPGNARKPWGRPNLFLAGKSGLRPKGVVGPVSVFITISRLVVMGPVSGFTMISRLVMVGPVSVFIMISRLVVMAPSVWLQNHIPAALFASKQFVVQAADPLHCCTQGRYAVCAADRRLQNIVWWGKAILRIPAHSFDTLNLHCNRTRTVSVK